MKIETKDFYSRLEYIIFFSANRDNTIDDKHCIIIKWRLRQVIGKKDFSLQKYLNRFDLHIAETLKKNFLIRKEIILPLQSATKCSKKLLNLRSEQGPKYDSLSSIR